MIYPGQTLQTDAASTQAQAQPTPTAAVQSTVKVTLQQGDSLWKLSQEYGVSVQAIVTANHLSSIYAMIHPGDVLTIPSAQQNAQAAEVQPTNYQAPQQQAPQQTAQIQAPAQSQNGTSQGTFKLSFYDPAVLGSDMGYSGVAANLSVFPKGTKLKITLSDGTVWYRTVNDTGTFAYSNPRQLDVAMPNSQIPSAGIMYANVEVLN